MILPGRGRPGRGRRRRSCSGPSAAAAISRQSGRRAARRRRRGRFDRGLVVDPDGPVRRPGCGWWPARISASSSVRCGRGSDFSKIGASLKRNRSRSRPSGAPASGRPSVPRRDDEQVAVRQRPVVAVQDRCRCRRRPARPTSRPAAGAVEGPAAAGASRCGWWAARPRRWSGWCSGRRRARARRRRAAPRPPAPAASAARRRCRPSGRPSGRGRARASAETGRRPGCPQSRSLRERSGWSCRSHLVRAELEELRSV